MSTSLNSTSANRFNFRAWNMRSAPSEMLYYGRDFYTLNSWKCDRGGIHSVGISPGNGQFQILVGDNSAAMPSALGDCILMQSTGLNDRNGKEIYEGDILRGTTYLYGWDLKRTGGKQFDFCGVVKWQAQCDVGLCWMLQDLDDTGGIELRDTVHRNMIDYSTGEIIGNIYQNPDLLPKA